MALTLVATAGAANANSYATVAEADTYHEARLYSSTWNSQLRPLREQALVWATALLDRHMTWHGARSTDTQALRWPRAGARDADEKLYVSTTIPAPVRDATAELARWLLDSDRVADATGDASRISAVTVGGVTVDYTGGGLAPTGTTIPMAVVSMLASVGSYTNAPGGATGAVALQRG